MKALAAERGGGLLYGTNFSIGVQKLFRLTAELAQLDGYSFSIDETHHTSKLDAPSGTALTLKEIILSVRPGIEIPVTSHRVGDAKGEHIVTAKSDCDMLELRHDASSRRGFAHRRSPWRRVARRQIRRLGFPRNLRRVVAAVCTGALPAASCARPLPHGIHSLLVETADFHGLKVCAPPDFRQFRRIFDNFLSAIERERRRQ